MTHRWIPLNNLDQIQEIKSKPGFSVIFKHSTQCPVSSMSKKTFEFEIDNIPDSASLYFLDLIRYREISNSVASIFNVRHESPQVILLQDGVEIFHSSHSDISATEIGELISSTATK